MSEQTIKTFHKKDLTIEVEEKKVFSFYMHMHSYYEMTLYKPFDGELFINHRKIVPDKLTAILVAPSDFHKTVVTEQKASEYIKLSFSEDVFSDMIMPETSMFLTDIKSDDFFVSLYKEIVKNKNNETYKKALVNTLVCIMTQRGERVLPAEKTRLGVKAVKIVNEAQWEMPSLTDVAQMLNVTPQYLSKIFKADMGITFANYLTSVRLRRAEKMIKETNHSITNICHMCGYGNFSHFIREFKKVYGRSPTAYRKKTREFDKV